MNSTGLRATLRDVLWIVAIFVVLGVVAGIVWWQLTDLPTFQRTQTGAVMDQRELGHRIRADGWFSVIGVVAAVGAGFTLLGWRRRDPLTVLVLGTAASVGAAFLALKLGMVLGHHDVAAEVRSAAVGDRVPDSLKLVSRSALLVWPIGFLASALAVLLGGDPNRDERNQREAAPVNESADTFSAG